MILSCLPLVCQGLVVPVIREAAKMNFADIEKEINTLAKKANDGSLSIDEMAGGSFTISNGGVYGSLLSTPIINPPQVWHFFRVNQYNGLYFPREKKKTYVCQTVNRVSLTEYEST